MEVLRPKLINDFHQMSITVGMMEDSLSALFLKHADHSAYDEYLSVLEALKEYAIDGHGIDEQALSKRADLAVSNFNAFLAVMKEAIPKQP
jgi:hypothetical protein